MTPIELFKSVRDYRRFGVTRDQQLVIRERWASVGIRNWFHALQVARLGQDRTGRGAL